MVEKEERVIIESYGVKMRSRMPIRSELFNVLNKNKPRDIKYIYINIISLA